jgi:2-dehydro-3-deoxy-D-arabinonate dehydratase
MKLYKIIRGILIEDNDQYFLLQNIEWDSFINRDDLFTLVNDELKNLSPIDDGKELIEKELLPPIGDQEIWASGVTYLRSMKARMEESKTSGGDSFYDKVYDAQRPELFFKALATRTVGSGGMVKIRKDSTWNVPEPELTLFITANKKIVGYTIGNDMSSRSIEGENPLYLPQAKTYDGSAGLGPCIYVSNGPIPSQTKISMEIIREGITIFDESISIDQMKRKHHELVEFLFRECSFNKGCFLMTGTGIIPPGDFTLQSKDEIRISIDPIGTLVNHVS